MVTDTNHNKKIFISYSDDDKEFVNRLTADLESAGMVVWTGKTEIEAGESISKKLKEMILKCDLFFIVLSGNSIEIKEIRREYRIAVSAQWEQDAALKIFTILLEKVQLPEFLKDKKLADFTGEYDRGLEELFKTLNIEPVKEKNVVSLEPREVAVTSQDDKFMEEVQSVIEKKLSDEDLDIETLYKKFYMGRSTFFRKVKAITGETPNQYINSYRLERAEQLLKQNYGNVAEVARVVGYDDPNYFSKLFKKKFKKLPKSFQLSHLKPPPGESQEKTTDMPDNRGNQTAAKLQPESPIKELELELTARFSFKPGNLKFYFKDTEGTPQRDEIFKGVKEFYTLVATLNTTRKYMSDSELIQLLQEAINKKKDEMYRSTEHAIECLDFHEILEPYEKQNALSAAAVCMKADLLPDRAGYFILRVKNYGQSFNLCETDPFYNQPVAAGRMYTGILVEQDIVLTAAHFANEKNVIDLRFIFDFVMQAPMTPPTRIHEKDIYKGVEILQRFHNPEADWTLVKLDRNVEGREVAKLSKEKVFFEQPVYVIGHPCGLPLKFASGAFVGDVNTSDSYFMADLNVYSSDDGSPVFSAETHELIGIVSRSRARDFRWTGNSWISLSYPHDHDDLNFYGTRCTRADQIGKYLAKNL